jgi:16S rRNA (uracil1498-N3)-methyltransferase
MSVRAPVAKLASGERTLSAESSQYLCRVLRLREGERFVAFDPESRTEADATILEASGSAARVTIGECHAASVVAETPVALVYGLAKGDKVDSVVRDATELGATRIVIARTTRAVAKLDGERAETKVERWRRIAEQAARQCGRSDPPVVDGVKGWGEALSLASSAGGDAAAKYCLWENATEPLAPLLRDALARGAPISFAIGPEGGLTEAEVEEARVLGYAPVSLGRFVLRTETVAAAVLGAVRILTVP